MFRQGPFLCGLGDLEFGEGLCVLLGAGRDFHGFDSLGFNIS